MPLSTRRTWCDTRAGARPDDPDFLLRDPAVNDRIREIFEAEGADAWYRPGFKQRVLEGLHVAGWPLALATSSDRRWVTRWLEQHGLLNLFTVLCTRDDVRRVKPDPELYVLAAQRLGLRAGDCLAVEDSLNGGLAAVAAGMRLVVVPNDVTRTQPFPPEWARLNDGFALGLVGLLEAAGVQGAGRG